MCHTGVLAVGGEHVTNDLAVGMKLSQTRAERLKLEHGSAVPDPRVSRRAVNFASDVGLDDKQVSVGHIQQIMHARLDELFQLIRADLDQHGLLRRINGSVLLTGGGARLPQINFLAQQMFELDVCLPRNRGSARGRIAASTRMHGGHGAGEVWSAPSAGASTKRSAGLADQLASDES